MYLVVDTIIDPGYSYPEYINLDFDAFYTTVLSK